MRRKLKVIPAALLGALALAVASVASAAPSGDVLGPACADIAAASVSYDGSHVTGTVRTGAQACSFVTYTVYVAYDAGSGLQTTSGEGAPLEFVDPVDSSGRVSFNGDNAVPVSDSDGIVCVYFTTAIGGHVFDRAPDTGCIEVSSTPPAQQSFT